VAFEQVRALRARGHDVTVRALFGDHTWYPYPINIEYVTDLAAPPHGFEPDVVVGTFWTTVEPAMKLPARLVVHLCQGCEFDYAEFSAFKKDIETVYAYPLAKMTVGEWLCERLRSRFGTDLFPVGCIGQIVDTDIYQPPGLMKNLRKLLHRNAAHILLVGMYECSFKGVPTGLDAVKQLREEGFHLQLTRVSPLPLSDTERMHTAIDQFHERISPLKMAELYRKADIFLAPSTTSEGFGLPFAEAMASGLPSVASRIPSFLSLAQRQDYAYFVPVGDAEAMAKGIRRILMRRRLRWHLSRRGPQVVRDRFSGETVAKKLEDYFYRMLSGGAWSESINPGSFPGGKGPKR